MPQPGPKVMFNCVLIRQATSWAGERMCQFINTLHMQDRCYSDRLLVTLFFCVFGREGHISHIPSADHSFPGAKPSTPILWELTQEEIFCQLLLFGWAILESWLDEYEGGGWSHPIYFITIYVQQRVCVCNTLLMKLSDSGKTVWLNPVVIADPLNPVWS